MEINKNNLPKWVKILLEDIEENNISTISHLMNNDIQTYAICYSIDYHRFCRVIDRNMNYGDGDIGQIHTIQLS